MDFFYHALMKKTRLPLFLPVIGLLVAITGSAYAETPPDPSRAATGFGDLAQNLYQLQHEPSAGNYGQCIGRYTTAHGTHAQGQLAPDTQAEDVITATMDRLSGQRGGMIQLQGRVVIQDRDRRLLTDEALMDQNNELLRFPQGLIVSEKDLVAQGRTAGVGLNGQSLSLQGVQWVMPALGLRGTAEALTRSADGKLVLRGAALTRCAPGNAGWRLGIDELEVDESAGVARGTGAVLQIRSLPVAYLPRVKVPLDAEQITGWQMPTGGVSSTDGVDIQVPYYWRISPQMNATLAPRWVSERGLGLDGNLSYTSSRQVAVMEVSYLPSDDLYNGLFDEDLYKELGGADRLGPFNAADRWLLAADQIGKLGAFRTRVDFTRTSDRDFFRDLNAYIGPTNPNALSQMFEVSYDSPHLNVRLRSMGFQRLDELDIADYEAVPSLQMNYRSNPLGQGLDLSVRAQWSQFDRNGPASAFDTADIEGSRSHFAPTLGYRKDYAGGFWAIKGGTKLTRYHFDRGPALAEEALKAQADRHVDFFSVDAGLVFEREVSLGGGGFWQTLEPRLYYLKQGYEEQNALPVFDTTPLSMTFEQLFLDNHFAGLDRIADADRATVALTSRLISPKGRELLTVSAGHLQHFARPRVRLPGFMDIGQHDLFAGDVAISLSHRWQVRSRQLWNYDQDKWEELGLSLHLRDDGVGRYNLGVTKRRLDNIKQAHISAFAPLNQNVAITARWHYDLEQHRTLEAFAGFEYDDCCFRLRLVARQYLENPSYRTFGVPESLLPDRLLRTDRSVLLEVQLKGLAGFGSKVEALMSRGVYGYDTPGIRMQR